MPGAGVARRRLAALLQQFDRWLDKRPEVVREPWGHTAWVFGAIGYRVDRRIRGVYPVVRDEEGRVVPAQFTMELFRPLATQHFLPFVLRHLGLSDAGRQKHLFRGETTIATEEYRISLEAYRRLRRDARFRELRARVLPAALALDPVLSTITLQARRTLATSIPNDQYSFVWRHEKELRAVARENPGLLPLVAAALDEGWSLPCCDAVKELNVVFREAGLAPATWRYVTRHGSRFLRPVWANAKRGHFTSSALEFLREIERAGHPAPPPAWVLRTWLRKSTCGRTKLAPGWNPVPPEVLRTCFAEARRVRGTPAEVVLEEDLRLVFTWAARERPQLDKLQRRAGWGWLLKEAFAGERRYLLLSTDGPKEWTCELETFKFGDYRATALHTVEAMVDEGAAFHNCLGTLVEDCQQGRKRYFVVRGVQSGERVAVVAISWEDRFSFWVLTDVKGIANIRVPSAVLEFAMFLAAEHASLAVAPPSPPANAFADLLDEAPVCTLPLVDGDHSGAAGAEELPG